MKMVLFRIRLIIVCLFFLREPENMRKYLAENEVTLNTKQKTKILKTIEQVEQENEAKVSRHFFDMLFSQVPSEDNGFKGVDYEKMCDFDKKYPGLNLVNYFHNNYGIYHLNEDQRIAFLNLYRDLRHELTKKNSGYQSRVEIATIYWLYKLLSLKHDSTQIHAVINSPKELSASNISAYLEANYTKELALDTISDELFMSKYYMCRIFKEYTGFTISEYVNTLRIKKATQILESSNLSISDVAAELGFESASYFERIFKKIMNVTPLKYRKTHQSVTIEHEELNTLDDSDYLD